MHCIDTVMVIFLSEKSVQNYNYAGLQGTKTELHIKCRW